MKPAIALIALSVFILIKPVSGVDMRDPEHTMSPAGYQKWKAMVAQNELYSAHRSAGLSALDKGEAAGAEAAFKLAVETKPDDPECQALLGRSLFLQDKFDEAGKIYRKLLYTRQVKNHFAPDETAAVADPTHGLAGTIYWQAGMEYTILLVKVKRWPEAVNVYEKTLPKAEEELGDSYLKIDAHFDANVPDPVGLEAAAHMLNGMEYCNGYIALAAAEFDKAYKLKPDWPLAKVYYAFGVQRTKGWLPAQPLWKDAVKSAKGDTKAFAEHFITDKTGEIK